MVKDAVSNRWSTTHTPYENLVQNPPRTKNTDNSEFTRTTTRNVWRNNMICRIFSTTERIPPNSWQHVIKTRTLTMIFLFKILSLRDSPWMDVHKSAVVLDPSFVSTSWVGELLLRFVFTSLHYRLQILFTSMQLGSEEIGEIQDTSFVNFFDSKSATFLEHVFHINRSISILGVGSNLLLSWSASDSQWPAFWLQKYIVTGTLSPRLSVIWSIFTNFVVYPYILLCWKRASNTDDAT